MGDEFGYCERTGPEFWAEPVNAITNLAFLIAAVLAYRHLARASAGRGAPGSLVALVLILVAIGIGSFLFHTLATPWAAALDTGPIMLFILTYAAVFPRWFLGLPWKWAWLGVPIFLVFAVGVGALLGMFVRGGLVGYVPALIGMVVFAVWLTAIGQRRSGAWFGGIALLFAVSLTMRTVDGPICGAFPLGTHFLWHMFNATVLYLVLRVAVDRWREVSGNRVARVGYPG